MSDNTEQVEDKEQVERELAEKASIEKIKRERQEERLQEKEKETARLNTVRGTVHIKFLVSGEVDMLFTGDVQPTDIQSAVYHLRMNYYSDYMAYRAADEKAAVKDNIERILAEKVAKEIEEEEVRVERVRLAKEEKKEREKVLEEKQIEADKIILARNKALEADRRERNAEQIAKIESVLGKPVEEPIVTEADEEKEVIQL